MLLRTITTVKYKGDGWNKGTTELAAEQNQVTGISTKRRKTAKIISLS